MRNDDDRSAIVRQWRKRPQFNCRFCAYNTLNEQKFIEHMVVAHPPLEILEGGMADHPPTPESTPGPEKSKGKKGGDD